MTKLSIRSFLLVFLCIVVFVTWKNVFGVAYSYNLQLTNPNTCEAYHDAKNLCFGSDALRINSITKLPLKKIALVSATCKLPEYISKTKNMCLDSDMNRFNCHVSNSKGLIEVDAHKYDITVFNLLKKISNSIDSNIFKLQSIQVKFDNHIKLVANNIDIYLGKENIFENLDNLNKIFNNEIHNICHTVSSVDFRYRNGVAISCK